jgi:hypothetical protein
LTVSRAIHEPHLITEFDYTLGVRLPQRKESPQNGLSSKFQ